MRQGVICMLIAALVLVAAGLVLLFWKGPRSSCPLRTRILTGIGAMAVSGALMGGGCALAFFTGNLSDQFANLAFAYEDYGFSYCFLQTWLNRGIRRPANYSQKAVADIVRSVEEKTAALSADPQTDVNVIFIQLESYIDPSMIQGLELSEDPVPNWTALKEAYSSGYLTVPVVGAGTANTEFEVLTGMSQHDFGVSEYPYKTVLKSKTSESICNDLAQIGYSSHAVHNNTATFYGRNKVFSNLGFDSFTSVEYMNNITLNPNGWAKDDVMVDEILKTLDDNKNKSDFTFGITVQSHGKYNDVKTDSKDPVKVYNAPTGKEESYEYYVNEINEVDQMIGKLVYALGKREKPTVLVLYGDHLPSLDLSNEDLEDGSLYETQYIIWNNYGLKEKDQDLKAYELYPEVLDQIGIHTGVITQFHQQADRSSDTYQTDLKALEYDLLYGENYIYDGEVPFTASNLQMGTNPLKIADVYQKDGQYIVRGDNFTPYCRVYFDGKELESQWIDEHHLKLKDVPERSDRKQDKQKNYEPDEIPNSFVVEVQNGDGVKLSYSNNLRWKNTSLGKK